MGPVRLLILAVALIAAIGAVVVVRGISKAQDNKAPVVAAPVVEKPTAQVLVAKRDLSPGTKLEVADMTWQSWPEESLNPSFIVEHTAPKPANENGAVKAAAAANDLAKAAVGAPDPALAALVGAVVRERILASEPMTDRKLVRSGNAGIMAITLEPGMRAMAIPLSAESGSGGFILPGDHVDVVMTHQLDNPNGGGGGAKRFASETVLRKVQVLAIDQSTGPPVKGSAVLGVTATLELDSKQAEVLSLSKAQGELTLVLRSYADAKGKAETVNQGSQDGTFKAAVVRVFRSSQPSEVMVSR